MEKVSKNGRKVKAIALLFFCFLPIYEKMKKVAKGVFIIYTRGWYRRETNRKEKKTTTHPFDQPFFPLPNYCMTWIFILPNPISKLYKYFTYIYIYIIIQARPL